MKHFHTFTYYSSLAVRARTTKRTNERSLQLVGFCVYVRYFPFVTVSLK